MLLLMSRRSLITLVPSSTDCAMCCARIVMVSRAPPIFRIDTPACNGMPTKNVNTPLAMSSRPLTSLRDLRPSISDMLIGLTLAIASRLFFDLSAVSPTVFRLLLASAAPLVTSEPCHAICTESLAILAICLLPCHDLGAGLYQCRECRSLCLHLCAEISRHEVRYFCAL